MDHPDLRQHVLQAADRPEVRAAVGELYARLQAAIDQRRPICELSGRCCRFDEFGHRLYLTTMELAAFASQARELKPTPSPNAGGCPFQSGKLCTVHIIRPFGCRIFFCDPTAADWQREQYESFHAELKRLHEELAVPYAYLEWRQALQAVFGAENALSPRPLCL